VYLDVPREGALEALRERLEAGDERRVGLALVDRECERDRILVAGGEEADLLEHAGEGASRVGAAREAEEEDLVARLPVLRARSSLVSPVARREATTRGEGVRERERDARP